MPSNEQAHAASQAAARALGQSTHKWDWHSYSWLVAAHLELGQVDRAGQLVDSALALLVAEDSPELRTGYADIVRAYVEQSGRWGQTERLVAPLLEPAPDESTEAGGPVACAQHAPGAGGAERPPFVLEARLSAQILRAEAALALGDAALAEARAAEAAIVVDQMKPWAKAGGRPGPSALATTRLAEIEARAVSLRAGTPEAGLAALAAIQETVDLEERRSISGPAFGLTARERKAAALLAAGRPSEAAQEFALVADIRPNRATALLGAARAARAAGDEAASQSSYAALAQLWGDADAGQSALAEVRSAVASQPRVAGRLGGTPVAQTSRP